MADLQVDGLEACELCAVQVAGTVGDGIDRLVGGAVPLDDSLQGGGPKPGCFRRRTLGRFEWPERGVSWVRRSHRKIQKTLAGKEAHHHRLRRRPSDRPVAGRNRQARLVAGGKRVSNIVHLRPD